jgi:hypothetical protein
MSKLSILVAAACILAESSPIAVSARDVVPASPRAIHRSGFARITWYFDGRDDARDFPTNGFFPGDFAANPGGAAIGAAGIFGSNPEHAYASQIAGSSRDQALCTRHHYHPRASGGIDPRRRC